MDLGNQYLVVKSLLQHNQEVPCLKCQDTTEEYAAGKKVITQREDKENLRGSPPKATLVAESE